MFHETIQTRLRRTLEALFPDEPPPPILVQPCADPRFGDYQTSSIIAFAKRRRVNPRQIAAAVLDRLDVSDICEPPEIAGAGFINFRLKSSALARVLESAARGEHLFHVPVAPPRTVIVDFSSPNVAKPMHVGHIRSTILGDCLARILRLLGHVVVTDNHIGDWGTQFGKLIVGWKWHMDRAALAGAPLEEMERLYKKVNALCEEDAAVLDHARRELVALQGGDRENRAIWEEMIRDSRAAFDAVYARLGVKFDHTLGESFYNELLPRVVEELQTRGLARESDGAVVVFFEDSANLKAHPAIIRKSDGAANYTTTDLATLRYREETWHPDEVVYVTDGRQQLHFRQLFEIYRRWRPSSTAKLVHVWFGSILGEDGRPFRTRSGDTVKLTDLLDEAEERAFAVVTEKNPSLPESRRREIARVVGIGAVKYADLLPNRQSDYVFDWGRMLALSGNTAPYLQYAYARICSIFRKAERDGVDSERSRGGSFGLVLTEPAELDLARHLVNFGFVLESVVADYRPNLLCNYLYELAGRFTRFYEQCPVLQAEADQRRGRLTMCELTARVLRQGLSLLGIETVDQM